MGAFFFRQAENIRLSNIVARLIPILLLCIPFFGKTGASEPTKITALYILTAIDIVWLLISGFWLRIRPGSPEFAALLWIFWGAFTSIFGIYPWGSVFGWYGRGQGVMFFVSLWILAVSIQLPERVFRKQNFGSFVALAGVSEGIILTIQAIAVLLTHGDAFRMVGTMGEANAAAAFVVICLPAVLFTPGIAFLLRGAGTAISIAGILATGSRSILVIAVCCIVWSVFRRFLPRSGKAVRYFRVIGVFAFCVAFVGPFLLFPRPGSETNNRVVFVRYGIDAFFRQPLTGYGFESTEAVMEREYIRHNVSIIDLVVDRTHVWPLDIGIWSGIPGIMLFLAAGWLVWKRIRMIPWVAVTFFVWIAVSLMHPVGVPLWIFVPFFSVIGRTSAQEDRQQK